MDLKALSGMRDYLGNAAEDIETIIKIARRIFSTAGFRGISTPVLEDARLFDRSLGSGSDVVSKEMYTVEQGKDRLIAMRPENTAGVVRALVENQLMANRNQLKLIYGGKMFRHERPQSGRLRQFNQVGGEVFGRSEPLADAELLQLSAQFLEDCGIDSFRLLLNSIGCEDCRGEYLEQLTTKIESYRDEICEDCRRRLDNNPLRVLDCKKEEDRRLYEQELPEILEYLCDPCASHFDRLRKYLEHLDVDYEIDSRLVRGLDYYSRTTFEFVSDELGSQDAILAGGRYDRLVEELGGDSVPAIGFSAGIERMMLLRDTYENDGISLDMDCFLIPLSEKCLTKLLPLLTEYRSSDHPVRDRCLRVECGNPSDSIRSQLRRANRYNARVVLIYGDREKENGEISIKNMISGSQKEINFPPGRRVLETLAETYTKD